MECVLYTRLDPSKREIRVLRPVWTSTPGPPRLSAPRTNPTENLKAVPDLALEFELEVVSLTDKPVFTALSYYWGGDEAAARPKLPITVNRKTVGIHDTLEAALRNLQYEDIAPAIWIDWLCINQKDDIEKSDQVLKMRDIYSTAAHVVIWLGDATRHSDFLAGAIRGFCNEYRRLFDVPSTPKWPLIEYFDEDYVSSPEDFYRFIDRCLEDPAVENPADTPYTAEAFVHWFTVFATCRHWWYRVWIIQEFVVAKKAFFQTGTRKFSLDELSTALLVLVAWKNLMERISSDPLRPSQKPPGSSFQPPAFEWPMRLLVAREQGQKSREPNMYQVLCQSYCHAYHDGSEPRIRSSFRIDYIYALVGLFGADFANLGLEVQYWKSYEAVYTEVAEKLIQSGRLDLLALCQRKELGALGCLPSWVPDWSKPIERPNMWFMTSHDGSEHPLGNSLFSAGSRTKIHATFSSGAGPEGIVSRRMHIRGVFVDTILDVQTAYLGTHARRPYDKNLIYGRLFRDLEILGRRSASLGFGVYSSSLLRDAAWRIPIRDHEIDTNEDGLRRATDLSRTRFYRFLPLFKTIDVHLKLLELSARNAEQSTPGAAARLRYAYFTAEFVSRNIWLYAQSYVRLKIRQLWFWIRFAASKMLPLPRVSVNGFPSSGGQNAELNVYIASMAVPPSRAFITQRGYIGLGPQALAPGDVVAIFFGARVPHILRPRSRGKHAAEHVLVGEAFVYGIMDGEYIDEDQDGQLFDIYEVSHPW